MKYKGKYIIASPHRPWWRHPVFPWGWYTLEEVPLDTDDEITTSGYYKPNDGYKVTYRLCDPSIGDDNGGGYVDLNENHN